MICRELIKALQGDVCQLVNAQDLKRTALYADAMESCRDYEETGEHVTWDEARSWLQSWGTKDEPEPPKCHQ